MIYFTLFSLVWSSTIETRKILNLNLWHIEYCEKNSTNISLYERTPFENSGDSKSMDDGRRLITKKNDEFREYVTYADILESEKLKHDKEKEKEKEKNEQRRRRSMASNVGGVTNPFIIGHNNVDIPGDSTLLNKFLDKMDSWLHTVSLCFPYFRNNLKKKNVNRKERLNIEPDSDMIDFGAMDEYFSVASSENQIENGNTNTNTNTNKLESNWQSNFVSNNYIDIYINSTYITTNQTCTIKSYSNYGLSFVFLFFLFVFGLDDNDLIHLL